MKMKLEQLTAEEAYVLANEYLRSLSDAGTTILSRTHLDIYNGLYLYAAVQDALFIARHSGDEKEVKRAIATINHSMPIVRQCANVVDRWLELGQPLDELLDWSTP
jgi:hypothetical protein